MGDADKDAPMPRRSSVKYGDKPKGRLGGTGPPPVEEREAGRDGKA
jgi:hypothetical protein